jgi:serine/threonine protein kinase
MTSPSSPIRNQIKETLNAKFTEESGVRSLNQYILLSQLGQGSFGTVYLGEDTELKRNVAIKECSKSRLRKQKFGMNAGRGGRGRGGRRITVSRPEVDPKANPIELVKTEVAILKQLDHKNVVRLFEVLDDPTQDSLFMVYELCERGAVLDLSMEHEVQPLAIEDARNVFQQLILGIEYRKI